MLPEPEHPAPPPNLLSPTLMNFKLVQDINLWERKAGRSRGGVVGDEDKRFCAFAIWVKYMFTHLQMSNSVAQRQFPYSPRPLQPGWLRAPSDFCNSYLDEWLKFRHSQRASHHSCLRKNGIAVIFWCIACHPACKRDTLNPPMPPRSVVPPFLSGGSPKSCLGWLIRCRGITGDLWEVCPPSQAKNTPACWSDVISKIGGTREDSCTQLIYGH